MCHDGSRKMTTTALHILGAGSMGQLWALSLRSAMPSYPVTLLLRGTGTANDKAYWWKPHGASLNSSRTQRVVVPTQYVSDIHGPLETLLVTTKSYQVKDAVQSVLERSKIHPTQVILLCNGALSVRDELLPILAQDTTSLVLATTTHGAYQQTNNTDTADERPYLVHAGRGRTFLQEEAKEWVEPWNKAGLNCSIMTRSEMECLLWKKLAANCVINPLTALFRCKNGELLMEPAFYELQQELLREVSQVAKASMGEDRIDFDQDKLRVFVQDVIHATGENKSSMLQDILLGKRTEIDHLNDYIVRKGRALGLECAANEDIVSRIRELSSNEKFSHN